MSLCVWNVGVGWGGGGHYARLRKAKDIRPSIVWTREGNGRGRRSAWKRRDEAIVSLTSMETVSKATFGEPRKDRAVERVRAFAKRIGIIQTHELNRTAAHLLSRLQTRHRDRQTDRQTDRQRQRDRETDRRRKKEEEKRKKPTAFLLVCFAELTEKQKTVSMVTERMMQKEWCFHTAQALVDCSWKLFWRTLPQRWSPQDTEIKVPFALNLELSTVSSLRGALHTVTLRVQPAAANSTFLIVSDWVCRSHLGIQFYTRERVLNVYWLIVVFDCPEAPKVGRGCLLSGIWGLSFDFFFLSPFLFFYLVMLHFQSCHVSGNGPLSWPPLSPPFNLTPLHPPLYPPPPITPPFTSPLNLPFPHIFFFLYIIIRRGWNVHLLMGCGRGCLQGKFYRHGLWVDMAL